MPARRTLLLNALLLALLASGYAWYTVRHGRTPMPPAIVVRTIVPLSDDYTVFLDTGRGFSPELAVVLPVEPSSEEVVLEFPLKLKGAQLAGVRFDPGDKAEVVPVRSISLRGPLDELTLLDANGAAYFTERHNLSLDTANSGRLRLGVSGVDPWIATRGDLRGITAEVLSGRPPLVRAFTTALLVFVLVLGLVMLFGTQAGRLRRLLPTSVLPDRTTAVLLVVDLFVGLGVLGIAGRMGHHAEGIHLRFEVLYPRADDFQLFYGNDAKRLDQLRSLYVRTKATREPQWIEFLLPPDSMPTHLRLDPGTGGDTLIIKRGEVMWEGARLPIDRQTLRHAVGDLHDADLLAGTGHGLSLALRPGDPYIHLALDLKERAKAIEGAGSRSFWSWLTAAICVLLVHSGLRRSTWLRAALEGSARRDVTLVVAFLAMLAVPMLMDMEPTLLPDQRSNEKRRLAPLPELELRSIGQFPQLYDAWYRDHFGYRSELFRWNSWFHVRVLGTSPLPDKLIVGKDGWLFQYDPVLDANFKGEPLFGFEDMERIRLQCEGHYRWLATMGIRYYLFIAPLSSTINAEHLPERFQRYKPGRWAAELKAHFDKYSTVPVIEPSEALFEAKKVRDVYFNNDIHWNPYGAYFGYRELIERIRKDDPRVPAPWSLDELRVRNDTNDQADIAHMLGLADVLLRVEPALEPRHKRKARFSRFPDLPGSVFFLDKAQTFANPDTTLPRLLMFHDSFGLYLKPLLNEHFRSSTYIWYPLLLPDVVLQERPDIVVHELMERFLVNLPQDTVRASR